MTKTRHAIAVSLLLGAFALPALAENLVTCRFNEVQVQVPATWKVQGREAMEAIARQAGAGNDGKDRLLLAYEPSDNAHIRLIRMPAKQTTREAVAELKAFSPDERRQFGEEMRDLYYTRYARTVTFKNFYTPAYLRIGQGNYETMLISYDRAGQRNPATTWLVRIHTVLGGRYNYVLTVSYDKGYPSLKTVTDGIINSLRID